MKLNSHKCQQYYTNRTIKHEKAKKKINFCFFFSVFVFISFQFDNFVFMLIIKWIEFQLVFINFCVFFFLLLFLSMTVTICFHQSNLFSYLLFLLMIIRWFVELNSGNFILHFLVGRYSLKTQHTQTHSIIFISQLCNYNEKKIMNKFFPQEIKTQI